MTVFKKLWLSVAPWTFADLWKPLGGGWVQKGRQARVTCIMIPVSDAGDFIFHPACLRCCGQHPMETCPGRRSQPPLSSLEPGVRER